MIREDREPQVILEKGIQARVVLHRLLKEVMFSLALKDRGMGKESPRQRKVCVHHTEFGVFKELTKVRHGWTAWEGG